MGALSSSHRENASRHPVLGNVRRETRDGRPLLAAELPLRDEDELRRWSEGLALARSFSNPDLYLPAAYSPGSGFSCAGQRSVTVYFEPLTTTLKADILERSSCDRYYQRGQLWKALYVLLRAAWDFEKRKQRMGNVHPETIFVVPGEGLSLRTACRYSWPGALHGIELHLEESSGCYLTPKELTQIGQHKLLPGQEVEARRDSFAVGMTLLEMGTLLSSEDAYNYYDHRLEKEVLDERLGLLHQRYNDALLRRFLDLLLACEDEGRASCGEMLALLQPNEQSILAQLPFELNHVTSKESLSRMARQTS